MESQSQSCPPHVHHVQYVPVYPQHSHCQSSFQDQSLLSSPSTHTHHSLQGEPRTTPNEFVLKQDGVISFSLRDLTLFGCVVVTVSLLYMLYKACSEDMVDCEYPVLPMISSVICLPFYDRIFCIISMFFCFTVLQADARAFYHKLQGIASQSQNDWMLGLMVIAVFTLPAIGYFDEHAYSTIHGICAALFFLSVGVYSWILSSVFSNNKDKFPAEKESQINRMSTVCNVMWVFLIGFLLGLAIQIDWMIPLMEWLTTLTFLNYFALISDFDDYYDSVVSVETPMYQRAVALKA